MDLQLQRELLNHELNEEPSARRSTRSYDAQRNDRQRVGKGLSIVLAIFLAVGALLMLSGLVSAETAGIQIEVSDGGVVVEAGDVYTYTIRINTSVTVTDIVITQTIQGDVQYQDCALQPPTVGLCSEIDGTLSITMASLLPSKNYTASTRFVANPGLTNNILSSVVTSGLDENGGSLPQATDAITTSVYVPRPQIELELDDGEETVQPGETISYTLTISNSGDAPANNLIPTFILPNGTHFISASDGVGDVAGQVTWPAIFLLPGDVTQRSVMLAVQHPVFSSLTDLTAVASAAYDNMPTPNPSDDDINSVASATVSGQIWHDVNGNGVQEPTEEGIAGTALIVSSPNLPHSVITSNVDGRYEVAGLALRPYTIEIDESTLPLGMVALYESDQSLDGQLPIDLKNGTQSDAADFGYARFAEIQDSFTWADINRDGLFNPDEPGIQGITWTLTSAGPDGTMDTTDDITTTLKSDANGRFGSPPLLPGKFRLILDDGSVPNGYANSIYPQGSSDGAVLFSLLSGQIAKDLNYGFGVLDLSVFKRVTDVEATTSSLVPYEIVVTNESPVRAQQVQLTEFIPENSSFIPSASHPDWRCPDGTDGGNRCHLLLGELPSNASTSLNFTVLTASAMPAHINTLVNRVEILDESVAVPDPTPHDNRYELNTTVKAEPELTVHQTDGNTRIEPGNVLQYSIDYMNQGNQDASGVVISMVVPANTRFAAANSSPGWQCADGSLPGTTCLYPIGLVPAGAGNMIDFGMTVDRSMPVNVASITAEVMIRDDDTGQDTDGELTPIDAAPDLILSSSQDNFLAFPGSHIEYTLHYTNTGNRDAIGVLIVETIPENTRFFEAASSPDWDCPDGPEVGKRCIYAVGALPVGASGTLQFAVLVNKDLTPVVGSIENMAVIAGSGIELDIQNNSSSSSIDLQVPTVVDLLNFTAVEQEDETLLIEWQTGAERNSWGFLLYRSTDADWGHATSMMPSLMQSVGNESSGARYSFSDGVAFKGITYYYWLHELEIGGHTNIYGPIAGRIGETIYPLHLTNQTYAPMIFR